MLNINCRFKDRRTETIGEKLYFLFLLVSVLYTPRSFFFLVVYFMAGPSYKMHRAYYKNPLRKVPMWNIFKRKRGFKTFKKPAMSVIFFQCKKREASFTNGHYSARFIMTSLSAIHFPAVWILQHLDIMFGWLTSTHTRGISAAFAWKYFNAPM